MPAAGERGTSSSASPVALAIPRTWQAKPALRHIATIGAARALRRRGDRRLAARPLRRSTSPSSSRRCSRSSASPRGEGRGARPADHRPRAPPLRRRHGARRGPRVRALLPRFPHRRARRARPQPPPPRGRGELPPGRARSHRVSPSTSRASSAAARVVGRRFLARRRASSRSRSSSSRRCSSSLFPRVGLSLLLLNHPHAGRMVGFSDHVDLGQVGVLRDDPSHRAARSTSAPSSAPPRRA